jgi:hypothetical protein
MHMTVQKRLLMCPLYERAIFIPVVIVIPLIFSFEIYKKYFGKKKDK